MSWSHRLAAPAAIRGEQAVAVAAAAVAVVGALLIVGVVIDMRAPTGVMPQSANSTVRPIAPVAANPAPPDRQKIATQLAEPAAPALASPDPPQPVFDVLRVEPSGEAVIAGHAASNAALELRADGQVVAEAKSDRLGDFTMSPPAFAAGPHRLELSARVGVESAVRSDPVTIDVPAGEAPATATLAPQPAEVVATSPAAPPTAGPIAPPAANSPKPNAKTLAQADHVTIVPRTSTPTPPRRPNFVNLPTKYSEVGSPKRDKALVAALPANGAPGGGHAPSK